MQFRRILSAFATVAVAACGATVPRAEPPIPTEPHVDNATDAGTSPSPSDDASSAVAEAPVPESPSGPCPKGMVFVEGSFCIDAFEASLVEVNADGTETPFPNYRSPDGKSVRAVSVKGAVPQTFISEVQASVACEQSGKRLCGWREWKTACEGSAHTAFPYGPSRTKSLCNDSGKNPVAAVFPELWATALKNAKSAPPKATPKKKRATKKSSKLGAAHAATKTKKKAPTKSAPLPASKKPADVSQELWTQLNDPRLGQVEGTVALTGSHEQCVNDFGVFDMVGNVHEWVATDLSLPHGTFAGGYFLDTSINGDGCNYATRAHAHDYHDYSTGFRCCADP